jgi:hypothetical protein
VLAEARFVVYNYLPMTDTIDKVVELPPPPRLLGEILTSNQRMALLGHLGQLELVRLLSELPREAVSEQHTITLDAMDDLYTTLRARARQVVDALSQPTVEDISYLQFLRNIHELEPEAELAIWLTFEAPEQTRQAYFEENNLTSYISDLPQVVLFDFEHRIRPLLHVGYPIHGAIFDTPKHIVRYCVDLAEGLY